MTSQYIIAGWRRSGLFPVYARKVLEKPEISRYRQTTPELRPSQSKVTLTPQDNYEYREISTLLSSKLSRSGKAKLKQLNHAFYEASSARKILSTELSNVRKRVLEDEEQATTKRLKKQDDKRIWDTKEVMTSRGYTEAEAEVFLSALPSRDIIYGTATELHN